MKFLAIDTSAKYLSVVAYADGRTESICLPDCALKHSVVLMDEIDKAFARAHLSPAECDFFAVCVGPGSFTGIRIGVSAVKGLCLAADKPALPVTSFDTIAYHEESGKTLALVDAGHGAFYACPYERAGEALRAGEPAFLTKEEAEALVKAGYVPRAAEEISIPAERADPAKGLLRAVLRKAGETVPAAGLAALYLRKSSAEEVRK